VADELWSPQEPSVSISKERVGQRDPLHQFWQKPILRFPEIHHFLVESLHPAVFSSLLLSSETPNDRCFTSDFRHGIKRTASIFKVSISSVTYLHILILFCEDHQDMWNSNLYGGYVLFKTWVSLETHFMSIGIPIPQNHALSQFARITLCMSRCASETKMRKRSLQRWLYLYFFVGFFGNGFKSFLQECSLLYAKLKWCDILQIVKKRKMPLCSALLGDCGDAFFREEWMKCGFSSTTLFSCPPVFSMPSSLIKGFSFQRHGYSLCTESQAQDFNIQMVFDYWHLWLEKAFPLQCQEHLTRFAHEEFGSVVFRLRSTLETCFREEGKSNARICIRMA
jgi:hypothetical protein